MNAIDFPTLPEAEQLFSSLRKAMPSNIQGTIWSVGRNSIEAMACLFRWEPCVRFVVADANPLLPK